MHKHGNRTFASREKSGQHNHHLLVSKQDVTQFVLSRVYAGGFHKLLVFGKLQYKKNSPQNGNRKSTG